MARTESVVRAPFLSGTERQSINYLLKLKNHGYTASMLYMRYKLFSVLVDGRPGDLILPYEATGKMGEKFQAQLVSGLQLIDPEISERVKDIVGI